MPDTSSATETDESRVSANADYGAGLRTGLAAALGQTGFKNRDLYDTFGWLEDPDEDEYFALYYRNGYARTVVDKPALTTWRNPPTIVDAADQEDTQFERDVETLARTHNLWSYGTRVDRLAGVGEHGLLVLGFSDIDTMADWSTDVRDNDAVDSLDDVVQLRTFGQAAIEGIEYGTAETDRWGLPEYYSIDLSEDADDESENEPGTIRVHWSRVIDVPATRLLDDETLARPRMEPVLNALMDIEKTLGAVAELAYRAADYGLNINLDPEKVDTQDGDAMELLDQEASDWYHGLQPFLRTVGADVERLGGEIADASNIIEPYLDQISAQTGIPKKELRGNESGEVSGAEADERSYLGTMSERREQYNTPHIVRSIIDRFLSVGVVSQPANENQQYHVEWPDLREQSEQEEADVQQSRAQVISAAGAALPGLTGERAEHFIETGEFLNEDPSANDRVDESLPDVRDTFNQLQSLANTETPTRNASVEAGDAVSTPGGNGVVTEVLDEGIEFDGDEFDAGGVVVALASGGFEIYSASEVDASEWFDEDVDPEKLADAQTANVYGDAMSANVDLHAPAFTGFLRANEDPEVGFRTLPDGWTRKSVLQAWASLGGTFRSCRADMAGEIASPTRFCAALKDEVLGTEEWRGKF